MVFFREGESPGHLKAFTLPPHGVRGEKPQDGSEVSYFQTMQSMRKRINCSKISKFVLPKTIFSEKNLEKLEIFYRNFWFFIEYLFEIFRILWKTYKCRENFEELSRLVRNFTVAAIGIFRGEHSGHLKTIKRPPQGVRGRRPADCSEVSFFKTIQSIWKRIHFSKMSPFFLPKRSIFSKKNLGKLYIFCKNFWIFFEKLFYNFTFYDTLETQRNSL